jgi:exopolysaccharide biosynthesis polyprenyl glycosylphosphotransferase
VSVLSLSGVEQLFDTLDPRTLEILEYRRDIPLGKRRGWLVRRALLVADMVALTGAFIAAELLVSAHGNQTGVLSQAAEVAVFVFLLPLWMVVAKLYGLYDKDEERADHTTADDLTRMFHLLTVSTFLLYALSRVTLWFSPTFSKLFVFWLIAIAGTGVLRVVARAYCRRHLSYLQNAIIVGAGEIGQTIARKLLKHPEYGINLVGFVDSDPKERMKGLDHLTLLGSHDELGELVTLLDVERVIFAFSNDDAETSLRLIRSLNDQNVQVDIVPRFFDVLSPVVDVHAVEGIPLIGLRPPRLERSSAILKRWVDVIGSSFGLLFLLPLLLISAVAIKLDSPGPVFFRQVRMGGGDKLFRIVKLRTMTSDAEERKAEVVHLNKHARNGGDARMFKIDDDPRVTRVGRLLRRFSIDELPQLWNVLRGEMSLVGPRPLILSEHAYVLDWAHRRLDLRPGITGLWQVLGRDAIAFDEMVKFDYLYVTTWSFGGDLRLLLRTFPLVYRGAPRC